MTERRLRFGHMELTLGVDEPLAARIRQNPIYKNLIKPVISPKPRDVHPLKTMEQNPARPAETKNALADAVAALRRKAVESPELADLINEVLEVEWYHSIDLGNGVVTPGKFDHRPNLPYIGLPEDMRGLRVLDVATLDGFWAFELERRGAEVVALDIDSFLDLDLPPALKKAWSSEESITRKTDLAFQIARRTLQSKVERVVLNVYDLSPERLGTFQIVFCGDLLLHLMNPVKAVQNIYSVCRGFAYFMEPYEPELERYGARNVMRYFGGWMTCLWWLPSLPCLQQIIMDAGFQRADVLSRFRQLDRKDNAVLSEAVVKAYV